MTFQEFKKVKDFMDCLDTLCMYRTLNRNNFAEDSYREKVDEYTEKMYSLFKDASTTNQTNEQKDA